MFISDRAKEALRNPKISDIIDQIVKVEGKLNDIKQDKGGITNHGVSLRYAIGVGLDMNHDGKVDAADIRLVDIPTARECFAEDFYAKPKLWMLPPSILESVFDFSVNCGPPRAIIALQESVNDFLRLPQCRGKWVEISEDGVIGKMTADAIAKAVVLLGVSTMLNDICERRIDWYNYIVQRDSTQKIFLNGWISRAKGLRNG
jgi:lysozyme family protein